MCGQDRAFPEVLHTDLDGVNVPASAWAGIAAIRLSSRRTVHNLFKLPVLILHTSTCSVTPNSRHADYLQSVTLFIMDEASEVPVHVLNALHMSNNMYDDVREISHGRTFPSEAKFFLRVRTSNKCCQLFQGSLEQLLLKTTSKAHPFGLYSLS